MAGRTGPVVAVFFIASPAADEPRATRRRRNRSQQIEKDRSFTHPTVLMPLDISRIRAISLDLDDTLWPVWPTIKRAEAALQAWLRLHAPRAHAAGDEPELRAELRRRASQALAGREHDMSALRLEAIRLLLVHAGEDESMAAAAFEVFLAERQQVDLFEDAVPALEFLSQRYPLIALSNGNADIVRVGLGHFFSGSVSAQQVGASKPDPRMFQRAASLAGVPVEAVLHIGDDVQHDGVGALEAGMQLVWLNRAGKHWDHGAAVPHLTVTSLGDLASHFESPPVNRLRADTEPDRS